MKYIFSTILVLSISVFAQEPDIEGYTSVYAQYSFCNLKEGKTFSDARPYIGEYVELANSFENDVNVGVLFPMLANEPDHDFFFVEHANSREEMGAYKDKMFSLIMAAGNNEQLPMECNVNFSAFQRVGPSSFDELPEGRRIVKYWPCNYKSGFNRGEMRQARRQMSLEAFEAGAEFGYRYIIPNSGYDREDDTDYYLSSVAPSEEASGKNSDIWWSSSRNSEHMDVIRKNTSCGRSTTYMAFALKE
jgi:hypothetical protein